MKDASERFRRNLRRFRLHKKQQEGDWSQEALAERLGVHRNYIGMLERGERTPSLTMLDQIADVLEIPAYELLMSCGGKEET